MSRWTAAQMLSWIALGKSLKLKEWPSDMEGRILPAQLKLAEAIAQQRISDARGRLGPPGSNERMPVVDLFSDSEFVMLVTPYGMLTVHPPHKRHKFEAKYGIDLDTWWREIDFDRDEGEQAFPLTPAPCQGRPHLRLVLEARSGEAKAPILPHPSATPEPTASKEPPVEQLTYAQIADRWGCSTEAARLRVARRNLPRTRGSDGKTLVAVSSQELLRQPPSARLPDGDRPVTGRSPVPPIESEPCVEPEPTPAADMGNRAGAITAATETATAAKTKRRRKKEAQEKIAEAVKKIWPLDGIVPLDLDPAKLMHAVEDLYKCEAAAKGSREKPRGPSWSSCKRFLEAQRST